MDISRPDRLASFSPWVLPSQRSRKAGVADKLGLQLRVQRGVVGDGLVVIGGAAAVGYRPGPLRVGAEQLGELGELPDGEQRHVLG
jgi:hypothetical protein